MNVSFEATCKTPGCENVLRMYVALPPDSYRERWCRECNRVHSYAASDFRVNEAKASMAQVKA